LGPSLGIAFGILTAFAIAFAIFFVAMDQLSRPPGGYIRPMEFYSQSFDPLEKRIFILGSSHAGSINATHINQYFLQGDLDHWHAYNLAKPADLPQDRLSELDRIISAKPAIVLYVVGMRDFEKSADQNNLAGIPDPIESIREIASPTQFIDYDFNEIRNPKLITLRTILFGILGESSDAEDWHDQDSPFYPIKKKENAIIIDDTALREQSEKAPDFMGIDPSTAEPLKKIIRSLKQENIKVVLVTSPYNKWYLYDVPDNHEDDFINLTEDISTEFDIPIYNVFFDKYANLDVWREIEHVSTARDASIFSDDVAEVLLSEIN
jgi:hypothetical protein